MKEWMAGAVLFTVACMAALASSTVLTGTWIVKDSRVGVRAIVLTVAMVETGPVVSFRQVSAPREGEELYAAIHDAAGIAQAETASMDDAPKEHSHWGGGRSWCRGEDCQRFYIFVGSSPKPAWGPRHSVVCQSSTHSIGTDSPRI